MEDRFTDGVKNAWKFAASEAAKLGSDYIGTEHVLAGIAHGIPLAARFWQPLA